MQALERTETKLFNNLIANPEEWEIVDTSLPSDRVRIHQLMRICLAEASLYMPGGMRRPPLVFGRSLLHVCRLECTKRPSRRARKTQPPLTPKSQAKLADLVRSPTSELALAPLGSIDTAGWFDSVVEEPEDHTEEEEELDEREASDKEAEDPMEALEALSMRRDRNAPHSQSSPTRVSAHMRNTVDWEEKAKELYFQTNWFKKEKKKQSWDNPSNDESHREEQDMDRSPTTLTKQKTSLSMGAVTSMKSTASSFVKPKMPGEVGSPTSPIRVPAGLPLPVFSPKSDHSGSSFGDASPTSLRKSAMAKDTSAGIKGRKPFAPAPAVPKKPMSAMEYLTARADQAMAARPESKEPLPSFPLDHLTEDSFHPVFLSPAVRLSEDGRVASQMKATNSTGLPWLPMPLSPTAAPDPIDALPSGGMAVTRRLVPVRRGVFPEAPAVQGVSFSVKIEAVDERWNDGLGIGLTAQDPDAWPEGRSRPRHAAALTSTWMCGHTGRWRLNGMDELLKAYRGKTWRPGNLKVGDVVTIAAALAPVDMLRILVNGKPVAEREASGAGLSSDHIARLRGVVDVEGSAVSVRLGVGGANAFAEAPGSPKAGERPKSSLATTSSTWRQRSPTASRVSSPSHKLSQLPQEVD
jgi:hypothetical protein